MTVVLERLYRCPVCGTRVSIDLTDDTLVLLQGRGGFVEHVLTVDDDEIHRCQLPGAVRGHFDVA